MVDNDYGEYAHEGNNINADSEESSKLAVLTPCFPG